MKANRIVPSKVEVGAAAVLVSAWNPAKVFTMVQADKANAQLVYVGDAGVTTAIGFGELAGATGDVATIVGPAAVYAIAGGASQNVRVLEGIE